MSFTNGELSAADVAAVTGNGNGMFGNNDGGFWLLILFLFAMMGGWGNNGNNAGNCANAAAIPAVQAGFDQAAIMSGINGLTTAVSNGFAGAELSRANTQANLTSQMNSLAMALQNCCCENRSSVADLKYTVATEACSDRQAVNDGVRDIMAANVTNTQLLLNAINQGFQNVDNRFCQQELDSYKRENDQLRQQIALQNTASLITGQTQTVLADNAAQTFALEQYLNPTAKPAYIVQNPNCCGQQFGGCGYVAA